MTQLKTFTAMPTTASLTAKAPAAEATSLWPSYSEPTAVEASDHFVTRNGERFAGTHLIADFWGAHHLNDLAAVENALRKAVIKAEATLLHIHLHHFTEGGGISGVAVLAESHISVHTWPEHGFAAFDVFMCGNAKPELAVAVLREAFKPTRVEVKEYLRGRALEL